MGRITRQRFDQAGGRDILGEIEVMHPGGMGGPRNCPRDRIRRGTEHREAAAHRGNHGLVVGGRGTERLHPRQVA